MKEEILKHLDEPATLEKMYRKDKAEFKKSFNAIYPELRGSYLATYWNERLNFSESGTFGLNKSELIFVAVASIIAGFIAKIPSIFSLNEEFFYPRNIGFVVFPALTAFFLWRNKVSPTKIFIVLAIFLASLLFINLLPHNTKSDTLILSCVHLLLFLWSVLGFSFVNSTKNDSNKRLGFLKYNGDLVVITALILIAGGLMSAITIGLFSLIGFNIAEQYMQNVGVFGLAAAPIVGTYLTQVNPQLVGKVSPMIARIFSPLVLVMLIVYVAVIMYSGKNPYTNRDFLLLFNGLLIGVLALIFFSIAGTSEKQKSKLEVFILLALSLVTIVVNGIALSAIIFRIAEWGFTPNRTAILGGNILILINLVLVAAQLFRYSSKKTSLESIGNSIAAYLPIYFIWTIIVTFIFPFLFGFK
ncbi:MAG: hypothetical protein EOO90_01840 [Pedobacter sp.]|nr:MAG: hypothetical protein EOO90_01840 [Pedobacter sp.]